MTHDDEFSVHVVGAQLWDPKRDNIDIVVLAVPAAAAQDVVTVSVAAGIRALLNFSPGTLKVPPGVKLKNVDLTVSLESLSFFLARGESDEGEE